MHNTNKAAMTGFLLCFTTIIFGIATNGGLTSILLLGLINMMRA